jgi:hypothetical protein
MYKLVIFWHPEVQC